MPTTSEILGLTPQEKAAAIFTAAGEAGPGKDALGVLQTILTRKAISGGKNIANLVKAPQQFVANDPYSLKQVTDPSYGLKVHGERYRQIEQSFENPQRMIEALQTAKGATQFRGQALLKAKKQGDVMFDPKGNFYFQQNPGVAKSLSEKLMKGVGQPQASASLQQPSGRTFIVYGDEADSSPSKFLGDYIQKMPSIQSGIDPLAMLTSAFSQTPDYLEEK